MNIVVLAPNPWRDIWRNRQQIFSRLAARHRVFYVEPARASLADWRRGRVALDDIRRPAVVEELPNLWLYRIPAFVPSRDTGGTFDRLSDHLLASHLRRTLRQLEFLPAAAHRSSFIVHRFPILWLYRPTHWRWAANAIPHRLLVYHITDDYTTFSHLTAAQREAMAVAERDLLAAADLTIVTAPRLLELKRPHARRIELVPNGVDYQAFQRAAANPRQLPQLAFLQSPPPSPQPPVPSPHPPSPTPHTPAPSPHPPSPTPHTPHPILGYSGHISSRLDLPLLRELALARPDWQFVFAGSEDVRGCEEELAALKTLPNLHFLGVLPVEDVPHFIAVCDVCLIPYRVNDETRSISSLKLYEYLAAGKPVVSARVPAAEEHSAVVRIAEGTSDAWLRQLEAALAERNVPTEIAARQVVAGRNMWEDRVRRIEDLLADAQPRAA